MLPAKRKGIPAKAVLSTKEKKKPMLRRLLQPLMQLADEKRKDPLKL